VILRERTDLQWFTAGRNGDAAYRCSVLFAFWQQGNNAWLFHSLPKFSSIFSKGTKKVQIRVTEATHMNLALN